jgi:hypothetical protein
MLILESLSPLSKKQAICGKNPRKQMNTCTLKQGNSNLIWKRGVPDLYSYNLAGAQFIFSCFWLPSLRFKLWTLAGYIYCLPSLFKSLHTTVLPIRWTSFCFPTWRASWKVHVLQTWWQSKNVWQRFCDRFLRRPLLTVSRSFVNVANSVLWRMAIILKTNKVNLFVSSVLFVFWYHSPNFLDTPLCQHL